MKLLAGLLFAASLLATTHTPARALPIDPFIIGWEPIEYHGRVGYNGGPGVGYCHIWPWGGFIGAVLC